MLAILENAYTSFDVSVNRYWLTESERGLVNPLKDTASALGLCIRARMVSVDVCAIEDSI